MDIAITRLSSKGQVVIPSKMRKDLDEGDELVIIRTKDQLILKKAGLVRKNFEDDVVFAKRTEEALKRVKKGKFIEMEFDDFIEEMKRW